ncbi:hypothetical protein Tco_1051294 [Tanacetum coccineum]
MDPHLRTRGATIYEEQGEKESKAKKPMIRKSKQLQKQRAIAYIGVYKLNKLQRQDQDANFINGRSSSSLHLLSKRKFVIVCHEKVVRIPLEGDEILRVHGERTQGVMNTLMNRKVEKLKAARDRQKNYVDNRRKPLEFEVGDRVMLKVSPWKGVIRFGKNGKLAPSYVGLLEILERIGPVAYQLRLPEELSRVHDIFHVSNLRKCLADASLHVPLDEIRVDKTLRFVEEPIKIMDREVKSLKRSRILLVKVH